MADTERALVDVLLALGRQREADLQAGVRRHANDPDADRLLHADPFALLLGILAQQHRTIPSEVWEVPWRLKARIGHLDPQRIAREEAPVRDAFASGIVCRAHRDRMAETTLRAAREVVDCYGGDASRVWSDTRDPREIERRFRRFYGAGPKIAAMAPAVLRRGFGASIDPGGDVAVDSNVRRVFQRTGLSLAQDGDAGVRSAATRLTPTDPAGLDLGAWLVGNTWCKRNRPKCLECHLLRECPDGARRTAGVLA